jgi:uncharacterized membrane protein YbhN (UPF0104 family)
MRLVREKTRQGLKLALKLSVSGGALLYLFNQLSWDEAWTVISSVKVIWLILALMFFIASGVVAAYRFQLLLRATDFELSKGYNVRLHWIGMFYNMFLPGGIGGDKYKVYVLNKFFDRPMKPLIQATLVDRMSGVAAMLFLVCIGYLFIADSALPDWLYYADLVLILVLIPLYTYLIGRFFPLFLNEVWITNFHSLVVWLMQLMCAYFVLRSIGAHDTILAYQVLFLLASLLALAPIAIDGLGVRELVFFLCGSFLGIDIRMAVVFSLLYFLIRLIVAAFGGFLRVKP